MKTLKNNKQQITEIKTQIVKSLDGWEGRTTTTENGQTFEILTFKRYSGNVLTSVRKVTKSYDRNSGFVITSSGSLMSKDFLTVDHGKIRATENAIKEAHYKGLAMFDKKIQETPIQEIKEHEPQIGDIIFLDGYGKGKGSKGNNWIIYKIESSHNKQYHCIEKDTLLLQVKDYVKPIEKKFGIGYYFEKGYNMQKFAINENTLSNMLIEAQEVKKQNLIKAHAEQAEEDKKAQEEKKYLSQFTHADRRKTTSIIKKHCLNKFNISKIEIKTDSFSGGSSMAVTYYSPEPIKQLEDFIKNFQYGHFNGMEDIYEYSNQNNIILEKHILQQYKYCSSCHEIGEGKKEIEKSTPTQKSAVSNTSKEIEISKNEEKNGIEVKFSRKPEDRILEELKQNGFRWSRYSGIWWTQYTAQKWEFVNNLLSVEK